MSGAMEAMSRRSPGVASLLLQFREASPGIEIRTGSQNTIPTGWVDQAGVDVKGNLLMEVAFSGVEECHIRVLRNALAGQFPFSGSAFGGLATIDDGSTASGNSPSNLQHVIVTVVTSGPMAD